FAHIEPVEARSVFGAGQTLETTTHRVTLRSGEDRTTAGIVSRSGGGAAYGGTPSDRSVMDAIAAIKARGLKVTLYPFVMMDIASDNSLPNPYGGVGQAAYPWRGRITC